MDVTLHVPTVHHRTLHAKKLASVCLLTTFAFVFVQSNANESRKAASTTTMNNTNVITCPSDDFFHTTSQGSNITADIAFLHPFLDPQRGLVPRVEYEVVVTFNDTWVEGSEIIFTSKPSGHFSGKNLTYTCNKSTTGVIQNAGPGKLYTSFTMLTTHNRQLDFIIALSKVDDKRKRTHLLSKTVAIRTECFSTISEVYRMVTEDDVPMSPGECTHGTVLLKSPDGSPIEVQLNWLLIPSRVTGWISLRNTSETDTAPTFQYFSSNRTEEFETLRVISEKGNVLITTHDCKDCEFEATLTTIATSLGCNVTLSSYKGVIDSRALYSSASTRGQCYVNLEAPPLHRIAVWLEASSNAKNKTCKDFTLKFYPVDRYDQIFVWAMCKNLKNSASFSSKNHRLTIFWIHNPEILHMTLSAQWTLKYKFFPPCSNKIFEGKSYGSFCSLGHPFVPTNCRNVVYSIHVPLGFTVGVSFSSLEFSSLEEKSSAFCDKNFVEIVSRNPGVRTSGVVLAKICGNGSASLPSTEKLPTISSTSNILDIKIVQRNDVNVAGIRFCASYKAILADEYLTTDCDFPWTSGGNYCYRLYFSSLSWSNALDFCRAKGGHLVSLTDETVSEVVENIIKSSSIYKTNHAFWIGANDIMYENCYEWTDGQSFEYTNWFPGWELYGGYGAQPSDDGLSHQNCVELRNLYKYPSKGEGLTENFFWNDRDCKVENPFICQKLKPGVSVGQELESSCNRTITLSPDHSYEVLTSPNFPNTYPNNLECHYDISSADGSSIVVTFTDFILEESESECEYDFLVLDDFVAVNKTTTWIRCGNWQSRIKLLRYVSRSPHLLATFVSDFSHSFSGFRVELTLKTGKKTNNAICNDEMFDMKNERCYLIVAYPEATWATAAQICSEARSKLAMIESTSELSILPDLLRTARGSPSGALFWIGASSNNAGMNWRWINGQPLNPKQIRISKPESFRGKFEKKLCLALQWRQGRNPGLLQWFGKKCEHPGGFICKKPAIVIPSNLNRTISSSSGNLTSINFPENYVNNLFYTTKIEAPPNTRIVIFFHHLDIEWQEDCLYDYVALKNHEYEDGVKFCGDKGKLGDSWQYESTSNVAYFTFHSDYSVTASGYFASFEAVDLSSCTTHSIDVRERISIVSPRYPRNYLSGLTCSTSLRTADNRFRLLFTVIDLDISADSFCFSDHLEISLDAFNGIPTEKKVRLCSNEDHIGKIYLSYRNEAVVTFRSQSINWAENKKRGYNITVSPVPGVDTLVESTIFVDGSGDLRSLNFPLNTPTGVNYTQRIIAPMGYRIFLLTPNVTRQPVNVLSSCDSTGLTAWDPYGGSTNHTLWEPCTRSVKPIDEGFSSTLNVLYIHSWTLDGTLLRYQIKFEVFKDESFLNASIAIAATINKVDSCDPNPCQHGGRCVGNGTYAKCHCIGQHTGLFCHLTWCDLDICGEFGECNLTNNGFVCECKSGFTGNRCRQLPTPCTPNPCENDGQCKATNESFTCFCNQFFEGARCENLLFRIPYKPLSQRMLEEPFWLGLITVFSVLVVILFVYCIKRKFADKIEKFLADEIERSKFQPSPPATRYSLSSTQPSLTPGSQSPQTCPKSLLSRIRKNSILSSTYSPQATPEKGHSRTFSFDDILRRVHSSKKKPNNGGRCAGTNSGCAANGSGGGGNAREEQPPPPMRQDEKSRILSSLVTSSNKNASRRMSLDEFFRMSERKMHLSAASRREAKSEDGGTTSTSETGNIRETSFISSPKRGRYSAPSFSEIHAIRELSVEYASSSDSVNEEPNTSEVQVDVLPNPVLYISEYHEENNVESADGRSLSEGSINQSQSPPASPSPPSILCTKQIMPLPAICITMDTNENKNSESEDATTSETAPGPQTPPAIDDCKQPKNPTVKSSYLEVPQCIPSIQVHSADQNLPDDEPHSTYDVPKRDGKSAQLCKADFVQPRKYSVDLPMPKILITSNVGSCDSDEASPPRTPNPGKSMMYLSPLAVISSSADRTISESNLSTSGYSSISSPGLSRCNSSSPISDDIEQAQHQHHSSCRRKSDCESPKKPLPQHALQMAQVAYLAVSGSDKAFYFPPTIACHCQEVTTTQSQQTGLSSKNSFPLTGRRTPTTKQGYDKSRLLMKRHSYQTTSTDDSVDDEGICMDAIDLKIRKGEVKSARDLEMFIASDNKVCSEQENSVSSSSASNDVVSGDKTDLLESNKPDLLVCAINKSGSVPSFKGSPRGSSRKSEKGKKHSDKHRKSPILTPSGTPVKDSDSSVEPTIPRNSSRTSMSAMNMSSSESDEADGSVGTRPKCQPRRMKKLHDATPWNSQRPAATQTAFSPPLHASLTEKISDGTTSVSESNGDSAPMDSRSPDTTSSSESLPSTRDSTLSGRNVYLEQSNPSPPKISVSPLCSKHRLALEHASSYPPPKKMNHQHYHSHHNIRHGFRETSLAPDNPCQEDRLPDVRQSTNVQPISWQRRDSANGGLWQNVTYSPGNRFGCGTLLPRPVLQSLNSVDSSLPSDSEDEVTQSTNQVKERFFKPLLRLSEQNSHPSLRRQEAIVEDELSDDSSSETTVLLRRPPTDSSISDRSSPFLQQKDNNSSSQSAEVSEWETPGSTMSQQNGSPTDHRSSAPSTEKENSN